MPTPFRHFAEVAARHAGIDPDDREAVTKWFHEELPKLPRAEIEQILEELLGLDGSDTADHRLGGYPSDVPLPTLKASRHVPPPFLAVGLLRRLLAILLRSQR